VDVSALEGARKCQKAYPAKAGQGVGGKTEIRGEGRRWRNPPRRGETVGGLY